MQLVFDYLINNEGYVQSCMYVCIYIHTDSKSLLVIDYLIKNSSKEVIVYTDTYTAVYTSCI